MAKKCDVCGGDGKYHKFEDRDIYEGYKLAPWYFCSCPAGRKLEKTQHVHVQNNKILRIYDTTGKIYEFEKGKIKKIEKNVI